MYYLGFSRLFQDFSVDVEGVLNSGGVLVLESFPFEGHFSVKSNFSDHPISRQLDHVNAKACKICHTSFPD